MTRDQRDLRTLIVLVLVLALLTMFATFAGAAESQVPPGASIPNAIKWVADNGGGTVTLLRGTHRISSIITVPSGVAVVGEGTPDATKGALPLSLDQWPTKVVMELSGTTAGDSYYGFKLAGGTSRVTFARLDITSNRGWLKMTDGANPDIAVLDCAIKTAGTREANGGYIAGIHCTTGAPRLKLLRNYFRDSYNIIRPWIIRGGDNITIEWNTYWRVTDGGHLLEPGDNCSFSYNYARGLHRMLVEIQGDTPSRGLRVVGNVAFDWWLPYGDSFGVSVVNHFASDTLVKDNYLVGNLGPFDGNGFDQNVHPEHKNRFGYGVEIGATGGATVEGNVIGGAFVTSVTASTKATLKANRSFGPRKWGVWTTEPGPPPDGKGTIIDAGGNTHDQNGQPPPPPGRPSVPPPPIEPPPTQPTTRPVVRVIAPKDVQVVVEQN